MERQTGLQYTILSIIEALSRAKGQDTVENDAVLRDTVSLVAHYQRSVHIASLAAFDARKGLPAVEMFCRVAAEHGNEAAAVYMAVRQAIDSYIFAPWHQLGE